ncbi:cadherin repeat domain-containing protein [Alphaproteobacteria bacterium]|nr:cadherin repeat domain-containing protein [Alphaproteobacteria bacterium]
MMPINPFVYIAPIDNVAPQFTQVTYTAMVREDADIDSAITLNNPIHASDANSDGLEYIILGGFDAPLFELNDDNEIVLIGNLDFETKQTLSLRIAVTDGSAWDAVSVDIYVKDVDEAPEFINEGPITILVAEDYTNDDGMPITTITAEDPENGMLEYFINGDDDGLFTINDSGQITLSEGKSLDYETATSHMFTVEVLDPESNSNKIDVMINVDDVIEDIVPEPALSADIV